jgi:hypothetical protein
MMWWSLPGPSAFVEAVIHDLREGKSVFLHLPAYCPVRLSVSLKQALGEDFAWLSSTADKDSSPINFLYELLVPDADPAQLRSPRTLVVQDSFQGYVIWLEGLSRANWPAWSEFFLEYERASRAVPPARRTHFIVPLPDAASDLKIPAAIGISQQTWDGWLRPADMRFYSYLRVGERRSPLETELSFALVAELAGWDPELCKWLAPLPVEQLTNPLERLAEFAKRRKWSSHSADTTRKGWCLGVCQAVQGKVVPHTSIMAIAGRSSEISHLIWRAEIEVLMPYIEEQRQDLLKKYQKSLWVPFTTKNNELIENHSDLEIGHIEYQLRASPGITRNEVGWASTLKRTRNCLSHLEPVDLELLTAILEHSDG